MAGGTITGLPPLPLSVQESALEAGSKKLTHYFGEFFYRVVPYRRP